jgi:4-aminobutyrate aminotransferase-like enzyme
VIRFLVPLTASDAIVEEGLGIVVQSLRELTAVPLKPAVNA